MLMTLYILIWPVISTVILAVLVAALWRDLRHAKRSGKSMI